VKIIITGGATGIGKSCVQTFHENTDVEIHLIYHSSEESAKQLEGKYIKIHKIDVTNETEISNFFDSIGNFDGLINNAGGNISFNQTYEYSTEDWNKTFELNTLSVFLMCKYGIPHINDGGTIVNISSISAKTGGAHGGMAYAASKAAVDCMTKSLAKELAPRNICVNAVSPGIVWTKQHQKFSDKEYYQSLIEKVPLGRDGKPEEIASLIWFLLSHESEYMTGQILEINGGMLV